MWEFFSSFRFIKHKKYTNIFNDKEISKSVFIAVSNLSYLCVIHSEPHNVFLFFLSLFFLLLCFPLLCFPLISVYRLILYSKIKTVMLSLFKHYKTFRKHIKNRFGNWFFEYHIKYWLVVMVMCVCVLRLIWISYTINDIWYGWTYSSR